MVLYGLARMFHELIWPQMQGAGHEAVVNLLRMSRNTADAAKATRPKGDIFRHKFGVKCLTLPVTVCLLKNRSNWNSTLCFLYKNLYISKNFMKYSG